MYMNIHIFIIQTAVAEPILSKNTRNNFTPEVTASKTHAIN